MTALSLACEKPSSKRTKLFRLIFAVYFGIGTVFLGCSKPIVPAETPSLPSTTIRTLPPKTVADTTVSPDFENALALIKRLNAKFEQDQNKAELPLVKLQLNFSKINDEGMSQLACLTKVRSLDMTGCFEVSDQGFAIVQAMKDLDSLNLWGCHKITDDGLASISGLDKLTWLNIGYTGFDTWTGSGLKNIEGLQKLKWLGLSSLHVLDDRNLESLTGLPALEELFLENARLVGDAGLKHVGKIKTLKNLELSSTEVSDAGIMELVGLEKLTRLRVKNTKVTSDGIAAIKKALPNLVVAIE